MRLPESLRREKDIIEAIAAEYGLDFFETHFEMVDFDELNEVAAYGGFPKRYPHWRFGMDYEKLSKGYQYGVTKIYELVINNDPCYAYLMSSNSLVAQKLVMAHVYGHCDFFKNNYAFKATRRNMIDVMANHATRIWRYIDRYGQSTVERFIDCCLSLENLIDPALPHIGPPSRVEEKHPDDDTREISVERLAAKDYMENYINPPEELERKRLEAIEAAKARPKFPLRPERDILLFLIYYAPLKKWQRDVLSIIREEAYYFAPQMRTKIMNEGWASYWHSTMMTNRICTDAEILEFADLHSATMATQPGQINPYKLGLELFRDIEDRWNRGRHGRDFDECSDISKRASWDTGEGKGREKIFDVRGIYDDVTFISEFLTEEFCERNRLFAWAHNPDRGRDEITSREFGEVKQQLLDSLTNAGQPFIYVEDGNYLNRGELLLRHQFSGSELDQRYIDRTLANIAEVWGRPVKLLTLVDDEETMYRSDEAAEDTSEEAA